MSPKGVAGVAESGADECSSSADRRTLFFTSSSSSCCCRWQEGHGRENALRVVAALVLVAAVVWGCRCPVIEMGEEDETTADNNDEEAGRSRSSPHSPQGR